MENGNSHPNGTNTVYVHAQELNNLITAVVSQLTPFIQRADDELALHKSGVIPSTSSLVNAQSPESLMSLLSQTLQIQPHGTSQQGLLSTLTTILDYSVNTSSPGFLDKLYAAPVSPGIAADLVLSVLNTNLHVYQVSPVLTVIERHVSRSLASLFGLTGPRAGGISVQGGSASNMTSIVIARNTLFPDTKIQGNGAQGRQLVMFTSAHGHYSIEKAAQACGFGSAAVIPVPVDPVTGSMLSTELERLILECKDQGKTPFYVNVTAGTTVLGSFDPFKDISQITKKHGLWMHIDGAWGGSFVFSPHLREQKLSGAHLADSIAINPHKMMGVPVTCSFLLGKDMKQFHQANTLPAGYLFHGAEDDEVMESRAVQHGEEQKGGDLEIEEEVWTEPNDLADLTLQCGRRGDSLKLFLAWQYYGTRGYEEKIEAAYGVASYMCGLVEQSDDLVLVSQNPPPCLQICFYYAPNGQFVFGEEHGQVKPPGLKQPKDSQIVLGKYNSKVTENITKALVPKGFMIDFAPSLEGQEERGKFFRVVVNIQTCQETTGILVKQILELGKDVVQDLRRRYGV